jgi:hypothetical protein
LGVGGGGVGRGRGALGWGGGVGWVGGGGGGGGVGVVVAGGGGGVDTNVLCPHAGRCPLLASWRPYDCAHATATHATDRTRARTHLRVRNVQAAGTARAIVLFLICSSVCGSSRFLSGFIGLLLALLAALLAALLLALERPLPPRPTASPRPPLPPIPRAPLPSSPGLRPPLPLARGSESSAAPMGPWHEAPIHWRARLSGLCCPHEG